MRHLSILFLIFLIITISGCIQGETPIVSTKDGLDITDFSFEYSPIYTGESIGLRLEVQNVGGSDAKLKNIQIYGVDFGTSNTYWNIRDSGSQVLSVNEELYRPNPEINLEGAEYHYEWRLKSPSGVTSETDYDFRVRVDYSYVTTYTGIIRLVDEDYLLSLSEEEREKLYGSGGIISSETTNGPISVTPFSGTHFIVESTEPRTIKFKIENVGKGYPYTCPDGLYCTNDNDNAQKYNLNIDTSGNVTCPNSVKLSSGKSHIIYCTFYPVLVENKVDKTFQIELEYSYYVDDSTSITVKPIY